MFNFFDSLVASVLNYGCEVWGFTSAECFERIHGKFCKWILNVKMSTNNYALYKELGRCPLIIGRQLRIVKYWFILKSELNANCILKTVYNCMKSQTTTASLPWLWTPKIKYLLRKNGFAEAWLFPDSVDMEIQSTLVISNSKGLSEILRDIRASTYQICRIEETIIRTTTFNKYICNWTLEARDILKILWKKGEISPLFHNLFFTCC